MPFAARMAQEHSTVHLVYTDPLRLVAWFYPQSSELINAAGILLMHSDWLSTLINLGWLAVSLLAPGASGVPTRLARRLGRLSPGARFGVLIALQPGEGRNDIMGLAFLIAFAAS